MYKYFVCLFIVIFTGFCDAKETRKDRKRAKKETIKQTKINKKIEHLEKKIHYFINQERAALGLQKLVITPLMKKLAQSHSNHMVAKRASFGHEQFQKRAERLFATNRYEIVAENVGFTSAATLKAQKLVKAWMASDEHKRHILSDFTRTGIGISLDSKGGCYVTQLFGKHIPKKQEKI